MQVLDQAVARPQFGALAPDSAPPLERLAARVPRYTSYPTANRFSDAVGPKDYEQWLAALADDAALSLYVHIPFCTQMCWYCACSTKATHRYAPVTRYLKSLAQEIDAVAARAPKRHRLTHLQWGGGSPDILTADDMLRLGERLRGAFHLDADTEFGMEVDPRLMTREKADSLAAIGVNRISVGVQDFDPAVQKAIGRIQSYDDSRSSIDLFRDRGVGSINVDLVYGLPLQTEESLGRTLEQVLTLCPDRVAVFGYAHLPARAHNQRLIDESVLPGAAQRLTFSAQIVRRLEAAGYRQLGLDHFARPHDSLAIRPLNRNFQGYTTDDADALIGLGASAIGRFAQGYVQNVVASGDYARRIDADGLATARGWRVSLDDAARAWVIERLMCDFTFSPRELLRRFGNGVMDIVLEAQALLRSDLADILVATDDGFRIQERARPFVRAVCARFDTYLRGGTAGATHSLAV